MSQTLVVYLGPRRVGVLSSAGGPVTFRYDADYAADPGRAPLSAALPLQAEPHAQRATLAFFGGLLPEENPRKRAASLLGLSEGNVIGLLDALGGDCAGAVTLLPEDAPFPPVVDASHPPVELSPGDLDERLRRATSDPFAASTSGAFRLSLAGAQAKLPVIWDHATGSAALPRSPRTPTTHILKPESEHFPGLVANEFFCMRLAKTAGLAVAAVDRAATTTGFPYLRVSRYDRALDADGTPQRLHQEDLCQALGIITEQKYESEGGPSLARGLAHLQSRSAAPGVDALALWDAAVFNALIGNCDAHGKNFSILWSEGGQRLAPLYDLVSTAVHVPPLTDPPLTTRLAMRIGHAKELHEVDRAAFAELAERAALQPGAVLRRLDRLAARVRTAAVDLAATDEHQAPIVSAIVEGIHRRAERITRP